MIENSNKYNNNINNKKEQKQEINNETNNTHNNNNQATLTVAKNTVNVGITISIVIT